MKKLIKGKIVESKNKLEDYDLYVLARLKSIIEDEDELRDFKDGAFKHFVKKFKLDFDLTFEKYKQMTDKITSISYIEDSIEIDSGEEYNGYDKIFFLKEEDSYGVFGYKA